MRSSAAALLLAILFVVPLGAQAPSGEISGVVSDPTAAVVPGVTITLINPSTNATRSVPTNEAGLYVIRALPPGVYNLKAELAGFRTVERRNIEVQVGSSNRIDVTLEIGEVNSIVEVSGGAPVLQTETTTLSTVRSEEEIKALQRTERQIQLALKILF